MAFPPLDGEPLALFAQSSFDDDLILPEDSVRSASPLTIPDRLGSHSPVPSRRRRPGGLHHVKHRRTRNGCFSCRARRVKCDETRPICVRCSKGNRDCTFPEPKTPGKSAGANKGERHDSGQQTPSLDLQMSLDEAEWDREKDATDQDAKSESSDVYEFQGLEPSLPRFSETSAGNSDIERVFTGSTDISSAPSSKTSDNGPEHTARIDTMSNNTPKPATSLSSDVQFYLNQFKHDISYHHYIFKHDTNNSFHDFLLKQALSYPPLLYAVVAFTAYHWAIKRGNGRIEDFLEYYNSSISALRSSIQSKEPRTDATILTMLQLAALEDFLGDWVSLLDHQEAALRMILELYEQQSTFKNPYRLQILSWYFRYDLTTAIMSGNEVSIGKDWITALATHLRVSTKQDPSNIIPKADAAACDHWILSYEIARLFAQVSRGQIQVDDFRNRADLIAREIDSWPERVDPKLKDPKYHLLGRNSASNDVRQAKGISPQQLLRTGPLAFFNFHIADWAATRALFAYKRAAVLQERTPASLRQSALDLKKIFGKLEEQADLPPVGLIKAQAPLGVACLLLPDEEPSIDWAREKLAKVESLGHIYPFTFRRQLALRWSLPELNHWWLPNEETFPPVVRRIRSYLQNRSAGNAQRKRSIAQRDMRGVFEKLSIHDDQDNGI